MKAIIMIKSRMQDYKIDPFIKETEIDFKNAKEFYRNSLQQFQRENNFNFKDLQDLINHGFCICTFDAQVNIYFPQKLSYDQIDWLYKKKELFATYGSLIQMIDGEKIERLIVENPIEKLYKKINEKSQRKTVIIPNENIINQNPFERVLIGKERHGIGAKEFSDLYSLGLTFQNIGLEENDYNGYVWLQALSMLGHLSLQIDDFDKIAVLHIPEIITPNQLNWINTEFPKVIQGIDNINACSIRRMETDYQIKEFVSDTSHKIFALESILNEIKMKYLLGNLKRRNAGGRNESQRK